MRKYRRNEETDNMNTMPIYFINGFLESGKTTFLRETIDEDYFAIDGTTLLIVCEEGEEEYDDSNLAKNKTVMEVIDEEADFTVEKLIELEKKHNPERIIIEYNGMWNIKEMKLPAYWEIQQQITFVDASTFATYFANMRSLLAEQIRLSDLIVFNRCQGIDELPSYRRSLKAINQRAEVVFEDADDEIVDQITEEDLPYDVKADVIQIYDEDFGICLEGNLLMGLTYTDSEPPMTLSMTFGQYGYIVDEEHCPRDYDWDYKADELFIKFMASKYPEYIEAYIRGYKGYLLEDLEAEIRYCDDRDEEKYFNKVIYLTTLCGLQNLSFPPTDQTQASSSGSMQS